MRKIFEKIAKKTSVFKFFFKIEARLVLMMFLNFGQIWASRSYKLGSYKKKKRVYGLVDIELSKNFSRIFLTISDTCLSAVRPSVFSTFSSSCLCSFSCISWILDSSVKLSSSLSRRRPASSGTHSHTATHSLAVAGVGAGCGSGLPSHLFPLACCRRVVSHLLLLIHALWPLWYSAYLPVLTSLHFPRLPFLRSLTTWSQLIL